MVTKNRDLYGVISNFILVPIILTCLPFLIKHIISESYGQLACDATVVVVALLLNHYFWRVKIQLFSWQHPGRQLLQCLPALLFLVFSRFSIVQTLSWQRLTSRVLLTVVFIALAEELVFRGLLLPLSLSLTHQHGFWAVIISSVGFGVAHIVNLAHMPLSLVLLQLILVVASGILWGTVYLTTHNLSLTILLHFFDDLPLFLTKSTATVSMGTASQIAQAAVIYLGITLVFCGISLLQLHLAHLAELRH